jgi:hypothetical protein
MGTVVVPDYEPRAVEPFDVETVLKHLTSAEKIDLLSGKLPGRERLPTLC